MLKIFKAAALAAAVAAVAGCAGVQSTHRSTSAVAHRFSPESAGEEGLQRSDKPAEAEQFWVSQRAPTGATALDAQQYLTAIQHANNLPWYSSGSNKKVGAAASPSQLQQLGAWQELGPGNIGGRTRVLRFQPGNPDTMFIAGVDGGLWKSTDAGASWNALTDLSPNLAIVSMVIDPANALRMWVGTGEGVFNGDARRGAGIFYSSDGGLSWNQLPGTANSNFNYVNDLVLSPNSPNTLYAATRTGLFRSLDGGVSWTNVIDTTATGANIFGGCFSIKAKPGGPNDLVVAACGSFGADAVFDTDVNGFPSPAVNGIVYRNTDAGGAGTWVNVLSATNQGRTTLAIAASNPSVMYALIAQGEQAPAGFYTDGLLGIWKSTDSGATWNPTLQTVDGDNRNNYLLLSNPVYGHLADCGYGGSNQFYNQGWYDNIVTVDPTDENVVWVGGIDLWRSDDGAQNFGNASFWWFGHSAISDPPDDPLYAHADQHSITFHPDYNGTSNQQMFVTSDGGIFRTDNATAAVGTTSTSDATNSVCGQANFPATTWTNLNNGYAVTQFYHGAVYPDNASYMAGAQDNGTSRGNDAAGPNAWEKLQGGDGGFVAVDHSNPQNLYLEFTGISMEYSTDGGLTFSDGTAGIADSGSFTNPFQIDGNQPSRLWTGGTKLWRTDNGMGLWSQAYNVALTGGRQFSAFGIAPMLPDLLLTGTNSGRVYKLTGATTATSATATPAYALPRSANRAYVSSFNFDGTQNESDPNARTAVIGYSSFNSGGATPQEPHVFKSTDGGATWAGIDGMTATGPSPNGLPDIPVNTVLIDPTTEGAQRIFVGTDIGVFVTTDGGASWYRENTGFANTAVVKLVMQRNPTTLQWELFAFTHGRSVFKTVVQPGPYIFGNGFD